MTEFGEVAAIAMPMPWLAPVTSARASMEGAGSVMVFLLLCLGRFSLLYDDVH